MDVDSQTDGAGAVMSGPDSDTESDAAADDEDDLLPETPYVFAPEDEFGEVFLVAVAGETNTHLIHIFGFWLSRPANKWKSWPRRTKA